MAKKKVKKSERVYNLRLTEEQCRVILKSAEFYGRLALGQIKTAIDVYYGFRNKVGGHTVQLDRYNYHCGELKSALTGLNANESYGIFNKEVDDSARVAWDIQQVVRHRLAWDRTPEGGYTVDFGTPMKSSQEPLPSIEEVK
jgi:hypothetical protein